MTLSEAANESVASPVDKTAAFLPGLLWGDVVVFPLLYPPAIGASNAAIRWLLLVKTWEEAGKKGGFHDNLVFCEVA